MMIFRAVFVLNGFFVDVFTVSILFMPVRPKLPDMFYNEIT